MTAGDENSGQRDRSPAYPIIPLETALERLAQFEAHFKRSAARPEKMGDAWNMKAKAHADRIAAALRYFGLLEYQPSPQGRQVTVSDEGRKYLRAQQEQTKREVIKAAALRPKQIAKFWEEWGQDRPADAACLDDLVLKNGFSEAGARDFLKVYDATISFAKLAPTDKVPDDQVGDVDDEVVENGSNPPSTYVPSKRREVKPGMKEDVFSLREGDVTLQWPETLSAESYQDLEDWTKLLLRKIKRAIGPENAIRYDDPAPVRNIHDEAKGG